MRYPKEVLGEDDDDGTIVGCVNDLEKAVVGHKIVSVEKDVDITTIGYSGREHHVKATVITLDSGKQVRLMDQDDCCAFTELEAFLLHPDKVDHMIMGVGTTESYGTWHIYADAGDVLELTVGWSCGNPFYYAYGFHISVEEL